MGTRPRYWLIRTKVGLVARVVAPSPRTTPWMKQVFPAPSSPTRATTSPGPSAAASRSPAASVSAALVVRSSVVTATEPLERLGERRDDIAGDQRFFADALGGDVAREPVQIDGALEGGAERVHVARERAEAVGVDRHGLRHLGGERTRRRPGLLVEPDPRPERDSIARRRELGHDLARLERERARAGLGQGLGHRFHAEA